MTRYLLLLCFLLISEASFGQTHLTKQTNIGIRNNEPNFQLLTTKNKVIGFRMISEQQLMNQQRTVQVLVADKNLNLESTVTFELQPYENLQAVDLDGDNLCFLSFYLQKDYRIRHRHIYIYNLQTHELAKQEVKGFRPVYFPNYRLDKAPAGNGINQVGTMGFNAFQVMEGKAFMAGMADNMLLLQVFDLNSEFLLKEEFIQADLHLLTFQKDPISKTLHLGVRHDDPKGLNKTTHYEFDQDGKLIQDFSLEPWREKNTVNRDLKFVSNPYEKYFFGIYGPRRNEASTGMYFYRVESIGEDHVFNYDFTNLTSFHDHLLPDAKTLKTKQVERNKKRGKPTPIKNQILINSFEQNEKGFLVYLNQYSHFHNPRASYNINKYMKYYSNSQVDRYDRYSPILPPNSQTPHTPSFTRVPREFTYLSGQFLHLDEEANILWDISIPFPRNFSYRSLPLASYHWEGDNLSYLMLSEDKLFASKFQDGTAVYLNRPINLDQICRRSKQYLQKDACLAAPRGPQLLTIRPKEDRGGW
jgi:hypothetical protein